jgi:hypothetical protein
MDIILEWAGKSRKQRQPNRWREEGRPAMAHGSGNANRAE